MSAPTPTPRLLDYEQHGHFTGYAPATVHETLQGLQQTHTVDGRHVSFVRNSVYITLRVAKKSGTTPDQFIVQVQAAMGKTSAVDTKETWDCRGENLNLKRESDTPADAPRIPFPQLLEIMDPSMVLEGLPGNIETFLGEPGEIEEVHMSHTRSATIVDGNKNLQIKCSMGFMRRKPSMITVTAHHSNNYRNTVTVVFDWKNDEWKHRKNPDLPLPNPFDKQVPISLGMLNRALAILSTRDATRDVLA
jgi:hypothetical protein